MKKTELKLTLTVNGRALSKKERTAILAKIERVMAKEIGGQTEVQGQEPLVTVTGGGGCSACQSCTSCTGRTG